MNQKNLTQRLADYCISEGTKYSEDGRWKIPYDELYDQFGVEVSDINDNGKLLKEKLQQREEINELIMTEDCIEMTYHLEYCQNCRQGGVNGTADLLSLMGCNLSNEHFTDEFKGITHKPYQISGRNRARTLLPPFLCKGASEYEENNCQYFLR